MSQSVTQPFNQPQPMSSTYLAGDIGGTNARIHLYHVPDKGNEELIEKETYKSTEFGSLTEVITQFLSDFEIEEVPQSASFCIAGPVENGKVIFTNLNWEISAKEIESDLGIKKVSFLNDFASIGYGLKLLKDEDFYSLTPDKKNVEGGLKIIIGAGTGLGEAFTFENEDEFFVIPGEGGHKDFAPTNRTEFELTQFIKRKLDITRVSVERIVSGPGIENIYWFLVEKHKSLENQEVSMKIKHSDSAGLIINKLAVDKTDELCERTMRLFIKCYGAEAGNIALSVLPTGGIYIAGGIAPQIRDIIKDDFMASFYDKGRMRQLLVNFNVQIIMNTSVGILGARYNARKNLCDQNSCLGRDLSTADIQTLRKRAELLSEQPKDEIKPVIHRSVSRKTEKAHKIHHSYLSPRSNQNENIKSLERDRSTFKDFAFVGIGVGLSALLLASFLIGKNSKK